MKDRGKRTLFIASQPFFEWRGSPIRLGYDVRAIQENGYEVDFLTLPIGERRDVPGVRIIRAPNVFFAKQISSSLDMFRLWLFWAEPFCPPLGSPRRVLKWRAKKRPAFR